MKPLPKQVRELYLEILNQFLVLTKFLAEKDISQALNTVGQIGTRLRDLQDELLDYFADME